VDVSERTSILDVLRAASPGATPEPLLDSAAPRAPAFAENLQSALRPNPPVSPPATPVSRQHPPSPHQPSPTATATAERSTEPPQPASSDAHARAPAANHPRGEGTRTAAPAQPASQAQPAAQAPNSATEGATDSEPVNADGAIPLEFVPVAVPLGDITRLPPETVAPPTTDALSPEPASPTPSPQHPFSPDATPTETEEDSPQTAPAPWQLLAAVADSLTPSRNGAPPVEATARPLPSSEEDVAPPPPVGLMAALAQSRARTVSGTPSPLGVELPIRERHASRRQFHLAGEPEKLVPSARDNEIAEQRLSADGSTTSAPSSSMVERGTESSIPGVSEPSTPPLAEPPATTPTAHNSRESPMVPALPLVAAQPLAGATLSSADATPIRPPTDSPAIAGSVVADTGTTATAADAAQPSLPQVEAEAPALSADRRATLSGRSSAFEDAPEQSRVVAANLLSSEALSASPHGTTSVLPAGVGSETEGLSDGEHRRPEEEASLSAAMPAREAPPAQMRLSPAASPVVSTQDRQRFIEHLTDVLTRSHDTGQQLTLRLSPPELGPLRVDVSLQQGVLTARLETYTEAARQVLLEHLPQLHEALSQRGASLDRIDVIRVKEGDSAGGAFSNPQWAAAEQQQHSEGRTTPRRRAADRLAARTETEPVSSPIVRDHGLQELNVRI